jgi:hypothetical protein
MTQIYAHPEIEDHFVEYDFDAVRTSPRDGGERDLRHRLMRDYVGEKCVLLRNVKVDYDRAFIAGIRFPHVWAFKKFASRSVESALPLKLDPAKQEICRELFNSDQGRYRKFEEEVKRVNGAIRGALDEILKDWRVSKRDIVWRHTETRVENLHFDIDKNADAFESVRLYYNMDDTPRIWHTTHGLSQLLAYYYDQLDLKTMANQPLERLLHVLSVRLFGNWQSRGREQFPRHMALFEPGDIWIVDGRTVPHQVIYGRRVISTFYRLDHQGMPAWHIPLGKQVAQLHADYAAGKKSAPVPFDMAGYHFPFEGEGPRPPRGTAHGNLKEDWGTIYEESIQQKLVRL